MNFMKSLPSFSTFVNTISLAGSGISSSVYSSISVMWIFPSTMISLSVAVSLISFARFHVKFVYLMFNVLFEIVKMHSFDGGMK